MDELSVNQHLGLKVPMKWAKTPQYRAEQLFASQDYLRDLTEENYDLSF